MKKIKYIVSIILLGFSGYVQALNYFWVGGSGNWSNFSTHWATTSGGTTFRTQVPISTDDVFFDANSFTGNGQTVNINTNAVCRNFNWTNSGQLFSGLVNGPTFNGVNNIEIFGNLTFDSRMRSIPYSGRLRFLSVGAQNIDAKGVKFTHVASDVKVTFENSGNWTLLSDFSIITGIEQQMGTLNFGSTNIQVGFFLKENASASVLNLQSSTVTLVGPGRHGYDPTVWDVNSNVTINAGTSTILADIQHIGGALQPANHFKAIFFGGNATYNNIRGAAGTTLILGDEFIPFNNTINNLLFLGKGIVYGNNTFQTNMTLTNGNEYIFGRNSTQTFSATATITAIGNCGSYITMLSDALETAGQARFSKGSAWTGSNINFANIFNIGFAQPITVSNSVNNGLNTGITFPAQTVTDIRWIGQDGDWNDPTQWNTGCVPTPNTNVIFDANSFTGPNQRLTITGKNAYCRSLNWTGATNNPELVHGDTKDVSLNIYGSLTFIPAMTNNLQKEIKFWGSGSNTIRSAGKTFKFPVYLNGIGTITNPSTYTLQDAFRVEGSTGNPFSGVLHHRAGTFTTANNTLQVRRFQARSFGIPQVLNLGSSVITIDNDLSDGTWDNFAWWAEPWTMTLNAGTSTINVNNSVLNATTRFNGGNGLRYYNVNFLNPEVQAELVDNNDNTIFNQLNFVGNGRFNSSNIIIDNQLRFSAGKTYLLKDGGNITLGSGATLNANGTCSDYIVIKSQNPPTQARIVKASGAAVTVNFVSLENIGASTVAFTANPGLDLGGNTGWLYTTPPSRTLFWVAGTGNWNSAANWSLTSGGAGGQCPPLLTDDVNFNALSFTAPGQSVTINVNPATARNMNWTGVTNNPALISTVSPQTDLSVYGSLTLAAAMDVSNFQGTLNLKGTSPSNTLSTAGLTLNNSYINFDANGGTYTLQDNFTTTNEDRFGRVHLKSGTLNTNNRNVQWNGFNAYQFNSSTFYTKARTLTLGTSRVEINGRTIENDWDARGAGFTLSAANSDLYLPGGNSTSEMGNFTYNKVTTINKFDGGTIRFGGNSTYKNLKLNTNTDISGNNSIIDTMYFAPGNTFKYAGGSTQTFSATSKVIIVGTPTNKIFLQPYPDAVPFNWVKPAGIVCVTNANVRYNVASGGAFFSLGFNPDLQPGNVNWDDAAFPPPGSVSLSGSNAICASASAALTFDVVGPFPKQIRYTDGTTIFTTPLINTTQYVVQVVPNTARTYSIISTSVDVCVDGSVINSGNAVITITPPPAITAQVNSETICSGDRVVFRVVATGTALVYQWKENGADIVEGGIYSGSKTATLTIEGATVSKTYTVLVTGACGNVTSTVGGSLTVKPKPTITNILRDTVCSTASTNIVLSAEASTTFIWTSAAVAGVKGNSNGNSSTIAQTLTNSTSNSITITYEVIPTLNGCPGSKAIFEVVVNRDLGFELNKASNATVCFNDKYPSRTILTNDSLTFSAANYNWSWTVPSGSALPGNVVKFQPNTNGRYIVRVQGKINGCFDSDTTNIIFSNLLANFDLGQPSDTVCINSSDSITSTRLEYRGTQYNWRWEVPTGSINPTPKTIVYPDRTGQYLAELTDRFSCKAKDSVFIQFSDSLKDFDLGSPTETICTGGSIADAKVIKATNTRYDNTTLYTWTWTVPAGQVNPGNASQIKPVKDGLYSVVIKDKWDCKRNDSKNISYFDDLFGFKLTVPKSTICFNAPLPDKTIVANDAKFNDLSTYEYTWTVPQNSKISIFNDKSIVVDTSGQYKALITNKTTKCFNSDSITVLYSDSLLALAFNKQSDTICFNEPLEFQTIKTTNRKYDNLANYTWTWMIQTNPIGFPNPGNATEVLPDRGGLYRAIVTDVHGCIDSASTTVNFDKSLQDLNLGDDSITVCININTFLTDNRYQTSDYTWLWDVPNLSKIADLTATSVKPDATGWYSAIVTNAFKCSNIDSIRVQYSDSLAGFSLANIPDTICASSILDTLKATNTRYNNLTNYTWNWQMPVGQTNVGNYYKILPTVSGQYIATVLDVWKCPATANKEVKFGKSIAIDLGPDTVACSTSNYTINPGEGFAKYEWNIPNHTASTYRPLTSDLYMVEVTDAAGCKGKDSVQVTYIPSINLELARVKDICDTDDDLSATITAKEGFDSYQWMDNPAGTDNTFRPTFPVFTGNSKVLDVTVTVTRLVCKATASTTVTFFKKDEGTLGADSTVCKGYEVLLDAGSNFLNYAWKSRQTGDSIIGTRQQYTANRADEYYVDLVSTCGLSTPTINISNFDTIKTNFIPDSLLCIGEKLLVRDLSENAKNKYHYTWYEKDSQTVLKDTIGNIETNVAGNFQVMVRDKNMCFLRDSIKVAMTDDCFKIPNLFTPNGDAENPTFQIKGIYVGEWSLEVYNRWGDRVYLNSMYDNSWDASNVDAGVYFYELKHAVKSKKYKGWLQVAK